MRCSSFHSYRIRKLCLCLQSSIYFSICSDRLHLIDYALSILPDSHLFYFVLQVVMFLFHQQKKRKNEKKHIFIHCCYLNNFTSYSLHIRLSKDSFTTPHEMLLICKMPPFRLPSDILSELVFHTCYAAL